MSDQTGTLTVTVESIIVGTRHRKDAGDLDALAVSIDQLGLLQPITVTPDRVLVCGWRRLQAVKRLGWRSIKVWVRSGISTPVAMLLAERDKNTQRKDYSPLEKEALYREIKTLLREDAAHRQAQTRFGGARGNANKRADKSGADGGVRRTPPGHPVEPRPAGEGKVRERAALIVTGRKSQNTLERISALVDLARDAQPERIRAMAAEALQRIEDGHPVYPEYEAVRAAVAAADPDRQTIEPVTSEDVQELLGTIKKNKNPHHERKTEIGGVSESPGRAARADSHEALRQWVGIWQPLEGWENRYDPAVVAPAVSDQDWTRFERIAAAIKRFERAGRAARQRARGTGSTAGGHGDRTETLF